VAERAGMRWFASYSTALPSLNTFQGRAGAAAVQLSRHR
jgi:hypothetical protein